MSIRGMVGAIALGTLLSVAVAVQPAHAFIHEIVAQWCAGQGELEPPGVIPGANNPDNVARPLFATGVLRITPYPAGGEGAILFDFDFTKPQLKVRPTGEIVQIGPGQFVEAFELDTDHGFAHCARLRGG
jgi:hypothetical protein